MARILIFALHFVTGINNRGILHVEECVATGRRRRQIPDLGYRGPREVPLARANVLPRCPVRDRGVRHHLVEILSLEVGHLRLISRVAHRHQQKRVFVEGPSENVP